jgi:hypothetical protein
MPQTKPREAYGFSPRYERVLQVAADAKTCVHRALLAFLGGSAPLALSETLVHVIWLQLPGH